MTLRGGWNRRRRTGRNEMKGYLKGLRGKYFAFVPGN